VSPAPYSRQFTIQVTEQMLHFIDTLALRQNTSRADIVRQALRAYLHEQEDTIASRTRLGRGVISRLDQMEQRLLEHQVRADTLLLSAIILMQMRQGVQGADILDRINKLAAHAAREIEAVLETRR
jgi:metal-responsive CopG/Arc/MetJ family transcriptional regulator